MRRWLVFKDGVEEEDGAVVDAVRRVEECGGAEG